MERVFPSITTLSKDKSTWRTKLQELRELPLTRVGLFLTGLKDEERKELYSELRSILKVKRFTIPFVHATSLMGETEFALLINEFGTEAFNLHPLSEYPLKSALSVSLRKRIFIENACPWIPLQASDIEGFAGVCVDTAHLEESRLNDPLVYSMTLKTAMRFGVGANHISAISSGVQLEDRPWVMYQAHTAKVASDLDYLFRIPSAVFARYCALELENPLHEQIELAKRVGNIIATTTLIDALHSEAA